MTITKLLVIWALAIAVTVNASDDRPPKSKRVIHRLVGGHIRTSPGELNDAELLMSESGGRTNRQQKLNVDEDKKTLSQQVADGKYGLIQKELFAKRPKRPGVLSYENNADVPKDTVTNLGGLDKNEIWLAENHLLVLKGGHYPPHDDRSDHGSSSAAAWAPIDDFKAPKRQVKIPSHPKVPPPFPVQLTDDGPLQILGTNATRTLNATLEPVARPVPSGETSNANDDRPSHVAAGASPTDTDTANATAGEAPLPIPPYAPGDYYPGNAQPPPFPYPVNGTFPPYFGSLPPGVAFLPPPPDNLTEPIDEDDPSIYYPPPYSFYYPTDNTTQVPPGPLVPGIVLPPPPNFFAPLEDETPKNNDNKTMTPKRVSTMRTTTEPTKQIRPTTTPLPPTSVVISNKPPKVTTTVKESTTTRPPHIVTSITVINRVKSNRTVVLVTTKKPYTPVERRPSHRRKPAVTILKPVKTTTTTNTPIVNYYEQNEVSGKPFDSYAPRSAFNKGRTLIATTQVPLKSYFSTSNEVLERDREPSYSVSTTQRPPNQFYFYEEEAKPTPSPTIAAQRKPVTFAPPKVQQTYLNIPQEYYVPAREIVRQRQPQRLVPVTTQLPRQQQPSPRQEQRQQQQQPNYYYVDNNRAVSPSSSTPQPDTFQIHIARLKGHIDTYYTTPRPRKLAYPPSPTPKPVYQFSFEANNYKQQHYDNYAPREQSQSPPPRYNVEIQPAVEVVPAKRPQLSPVYRQRNKNPIPQLYFQPKQQSKPIVTGTYDYDEEDGDDKRYVATPSPITQYSFEATPNPIYQQGYYTKQDERLFDDITKKYFTVFGQKLTNTSPMPPIDSSTNKPYDAPQQQQQQYLQETAKPVHVEYAQTVGKSLHGDTYVNYVRPHNLPTDPRAEYLPPPRFVQRDHSLRGDTDVNYNGRRRPNPHAEIVEAINVPLKGVESESKNGASYVSYELPGDDGAHFYFITPQLANRRGQGVGYYYSHQPANPRAKRNNRGRGS